MKNKLLKALAAVACGMLLLPLQAGADSTLQYDVTADNTTHEGTVYVRDGRVRVNMQPSQWTLYIQSEDALYMVDADRKLYRRVDNTTIDDIRERFEALRAGIRERLKELEPEQREQMRERLQDILAEPQKAPLKIHDLGKTDQVAGFRCERKTVMQDDAIRQTLCVAPIDELHVTPDEFETMKRMFRLVTKLTTISGASGESIPYIEGLDGVPIATASKDGSVKQSLTKISHESLQDAMFKLPDDFSEMKPPEQDDAAKSQ